MGMPYITTEAFQSPTFEFPPGAYELEPYPSPTETVAPFRAPCPWMPRARRSCRAG